MKKLLSLALALLMVASLAACGSSPNGSASSSPSVSQTENQSATGSNSADADSATASAAVPSQNDSVQKLPTFGVSYTGLLDVLKESHTGFDDEPVINTMQTSDGIMLNQYVYTADNFISVQFYETEDNELQQVITIASYAEITEDQARNLGAFFALITGAFEPEPDVLKQIDTKLDIVNSGFTSGTCNLASGTLADYMYVVDNSSAMVTITAI
ncbi:hypothetical protein [Oscillibacter sp.]|uniref:hypothetical protein n=1 Tax=Oscillibacter sp. TaxID=1945593 RepID=UPI00289B8C57|nr:hypothetical protein [Oscillibacter sp.]